MAKLPALFLDRDGVLNRAKVKAGKPHPPANLAELEILPGVVEALAQAKQLGYKLIVVTNQPDVARGTMTRETVEEINQHLQAHLSLDAIYVCYHDDSDECACRKPKPGLLLQGAEQWSIDLAASFMIGDRDKDISAGQAVGCRTVFINNQYAAEPAIPQADYVCASLLAAMTFIAKYKELV